MTAPGGDQLDRARQQLVLDRGGSPPRPPSIGRVYVSSIGSLHEDRPGVDALVDEVHRHPGHPHAVGDRLPDRVEPGERRQQRRVDVDDPVAEAAR